MFIVNNVFLTFFTKFKFIVKEKMYFISQRNLKRKVMGRFFNTAYQFRN